MDLWKVKLLDISNSKGIRKINFSIPYVYFHPWIYNIWKISSNPIEQIKHILSEMENNKNKLFEISDKLNSHNKNHMTHILILELICKETADMISKGIDHLTSPLKKYSL